MNGVNRVTLIGNLGKDPETRTMENGTKFTRCSIATNERFTSKTGDKVTRTEWHHVIMWRGLADIGEKLLKKGSLIYLEGKLRNSSYTDKEGNIKYVTDIEAESFTLLTKSEADGNGDPRQEGNLEIVAESAVGDDLPY